MTHRVYVHGQGAPTSRTGGGAARGGAPAGVAGFAEGLLLVDCVAAGRKGVDRAAHARRAAAG